MTNKDNGTLYTGMTNDIYRRVREHKSEETDGFTKKYHIHRLVYMHEFQYVREAIAWEKEVKNLLRAKKIALIESKNPNWNDISEH